MQDVKIKQQIVEKIKESTDILITVSANPSVDDLCAALGVTIMLNKLEKHATAVFSGSIPKAISFLDPEKTFEGTVDGLRDFIISLDKDKADHLRYKVDGDVVKIFITPYRTTINSDDLEFSQGDFNVEMVIALGVSSKDHLDKALASGNRIFDDAMVATITCGKVASNVGSVDWHDDNASSLCEMLVSLSEALKGEKNIIDKQIATAFLTGIVDATDRFSNTKTTSKAMTMAAQLMAIGADQQLVASKLEESHEIEERPKPMANNENLAQPSVTNVVPTVEEKAPNNSNGTLTVDHERNGNLDEVAKQVAIDNEEDAEKVAQQAVDNRLQQMSETDIRNINPMRGAVDWKPKPKVSDYEENNNEESPLLGGTLNATTEQAAEDKRKEEEESMNKTILTHNYSDDEKQDDYEPTLAEIDAKNRMINREDQTVQARANIDALFSGQNIPAQGVNRNEFAQHLPLPPEMPEFPEGSLPPIYNHSDKQNIPEQHHEEETTNQFVDNQFSNDPGQFKIPNQNK
jgi:hypothetical protein